MFVFHNGIICLYMINYHSIKWILGVVLGTLMLYYVTSLHYISGHVVLRNLRELQLQAITAGFESGEKKRGWDG